MSLHMLGAAYWRASDDPTDVVAQRYDELRRPRQGLQSFQPVVAEIENVWDNRASLALHDPDQWDLDGLPAEVLTDDGEWVAVGAVDFTALNRGPVGSIKVYSMAQARDIVTDAQRTAADAIALAKETASRPALPGDTARQNVFWRLDWHKKNIDSMFASPANAPYPSTDDLRKWALAAYSELNAVEDGRNEQDRVAGQRLQAISDRVASLPAVAGEALRGAVNNVVEGVTGIPVWAWGLGAAALTGLVGYAGYKLLLVAAPVATKVVAERYLPRV